MAVPDVVGVDGAEALYGGGSERDARRAADVLHLLHLTNASLKYTEEENLPLRDRFFESAAF